MTILDRPTEVRSSETSNVPVTPSRAGRDRKSSTLERLPILLVALVACLSVGYGVGTLAQFDNDWRGETPTLVASAQTTADVGADLDAVISSALADTVVPVSEVACASGASVGDGENRLCRARATSGMVNVVVTGPASDLRVDVYSAA